MKLVLKKSWFFPARNMLVSSLVVWGAFYGIAQNEEMLSYPLILGLGTLNIIILFYFWISWKWETYICSPDSLIHSYGVLFRTKEFHSLENINTIAVKQGIIGLIFRYGNVRMYSPFSEEPYRIKEIPNPFQTAEEIERMLPGEIPIQNLSPTVFKKERNKKE